MRRREKAESERDVKGRDIEGIIRMAMEIGGGAGREDMKGERKREKEG